MLRGGSWFYDPALLRSASRSRDSPGNRYGVNGLRLALSTNTPPLSTAAPSPGSSSAADAAQRSAAAARAVAAAATARSEPIADPRTSSKQAAGPSASYAGRVRAKLKPNIVLREETRAQISGNPEAKVEVKASADGSITDRKLIKSSGVKAWDDAVLRAIDKTESLPRDVDGRVPSPLVLSFWPKD